MRSVISFLRFNTIRFLERMCSPETLCRLLLPVAGLRAAFKKRRSPLPLPAALGQGSVIPGTNKASPNHWRNFYFNSTLGFFPARLSAPEWRRRCSFSGFEALREVQRQRRPAILVICHFGPCFLLRHWLQAAGFRAATLVNGRAEKRAYLQRLKDGVTRFPDIPAVLYASELRAVKDFLVGGNVLVIAVDSQPGNQLEFSLDDRFHFRMATGVLRLAARHGARVFSCNIIDEDRWRFRIELGRPVPEQFLSGKPDFRAAGKHLLDEMLPCFRTHPEQGSKMLFDSFRDAGPCRTPSNSLPELHQNMNLNEFLNDSVARWPQKPAVIEGRQVVSYAALAEIISGFERRLESLSLSAGCRIGLLVPNRIDYIALTYALWRIRAVVVPIPVECPSDEVAAIVEQMQLSAILSSKPLAGGMPFAPEYYLVRTTTAVKPDNHGLNIALIRFTSGTTNARKGVVLCHETIRDRVVSANKSLNIVAADVIMWSLPMAHHFLISIVLYLSRGATIVLANHTTPSAFLAEAARRQATVLYAAPRYFALLARDESGAALPSVRLAISTTSSLPENVAKDFYGRFRLPLIQALGVIELGLVAVNLAEPLERWNSVGRPAGDFCVRIIDPNADGRGELAVSGPGILDAYAVPWIPREQVLQDGWFSTGDIARIDADGFIYLLSRKTAVINRAGCKIFPEEVEAVINSHPDVRESRVFSRRHPQLGEVVEAELVLVRGDASLNSIREFCQVRLAQYKIPACLHVVPELPRTAVTGKILRSSVDDRRV